MTNPISNIRATPRGRGAKVKIDAARGGIEVAVGAVSTADITAHGTPSAEQLFEAVGTVTPPDPVPPVIAFVSKDTNNYTISIGGGLYLTAIYPLYKLATDDEWTELDPIAGNATAYTFTGLDHTTEYDFTLRVANEQFDQAFSDEIRDTTAAPPVLAVVAPTIAEGLVGSSSIGITITGGENIVILIPQIRETGETEWASRSAISPESTGYTYSGLDSETEYDLRLVASNEEYTEPSNTLSAVETAAAQDWQLPEGHYEPANLAPYFNCPRPQSEMQSWERYRLAPHGVPWSAPVGVMFGSYPYRYVIVQGPSGMTVGETLIEDENGFLVPGDDYGLLQWANPTIGTHTIKVRVETQDLGRQPSGRSDATWGSIETEWELVVRNREDLAYFRWLSPTGNDTTGDGSYSNPWQTLAQIANNTGMGGRQLHLMEGTYTTTASASTIAMNGTARPAVMVFHGDCTLNYTTSNIQLASGGYISNVKTSTAGGYITANVQLFLNLANSQRIVYYSVDFEDTERGSAGNDNATSIWIGRNTPRRYISIIRCKDTGRNQNGSNICGLFDMYTTRDVLVTHCLVHGSSGNTQPHMYFKDSIERGCVRANRSTQTVSSNYSIGTGMSDSGNPSFPSTNLEYSYNYFDGGMNLHREGSTVTSERLVWIFRNSIKGAIRVAFATSPETKFFQSNNAHQGSNTSGNGQETRIISGDEVTATSGVFDEDFKLTTLYSAYIGTRGAEIKP